MIGHVHHVNAVLDGQGGVLGAGDAALEAARVPVDVMDLSGHGLATIGMVIYQHLYRHGRSDVYGISATMPQMPAAVAILQALRDFAPRARVILGGAHPTLINAAARNGVSRSVAMLAELATLVDEATTALEAYDYARALERTERLLAPAVVLPTTISIDHPHIVDF